MTPALHCVFACAAALLFAACGTSILSNSGTPMNTKNLRTECIGRILIDLPEGAPLSWDQDFDWAKVVAVTEPMATKDDFWRIVSARESELRAKKHSEADSTLGPVHRLPDQGAILLFYESEMTTAGGFSMERYVWADTVGFRLFNDTLDDSPVDLQAYSRVFKQMRGRKGLPAQPGFCIDRGLVTGQWPDLSASISLSVPGWEKTRMFISSLEDDQLPITNVDDYGPVSDLKKLKWTIREVKSQFPDDWKKSPTFPIKLEVIREQSRDLMGRRGEEVVWRQELRNGNVIYQFNWSTHDGHGSSTRPGVSVSITSGDDDENGHTRPITQRPPEAELLGLWDAVLESIRMR